MPDTGVQRDNPPRMEELLNVAARLFHEKGVKATSLAEIGDELGMNKASLYYYIKSKEDLLTRVIFRASQRLRDLAEGIAADTAAPDQALERLKAGTYGVCVVSGKPIPKERLRAIPWAAERVEYKTGGFLRR